MHRKYGSGDASIRVYNYVGVSGGWVRIGGSRRKKHYIDFTCTHIKRHIDSEFRPEHREELFSYSIYFCMRVKRVQVFPRRAYEGVRASSFFSCTHAWGALCKIFWSTQCEVCSVKLARAGFSPRPLIFGIFFEGYNSVGSSAIILKEKKKTFCIHFSH